MTTTFIPSAWAFEFHGHQCPLADSGPARLISSYLLSPLEPSDIDTSVDTGKRVRASDLAASGGA